MENHGIVMFLEQSLDDMKQYMQSTITAYLQLRGRGNSFLPFWDCVVITACDADQALAFRLQLDQKEKAKLVPATKFIVVEDVPPFPGCKIGAGGSTFLVIERLRKLYGTDLERQKILLIHAGGWSQRLPSASILGKLFMPLPIGNFDMDMLDLKLALYMPFIPFMKPGIFLTASDDIELFNLTLPTPSSPHSGFVCLGHPSSLHIGSTHGVYVCDKSSTVGLSSFLGCHRVLQKPTEQEMWNAGAVLRGQSGGADGIPFVISDSAYWFDMEIVGKLERFYQKHGIPEVEVDAYGDFLQPLGDAATQDYIDKGKNAKLSDTRRDLFSCLRDAPVQVLFLPQSLFLHLGTMPEYLHNVLSDKMFRECFDIRNTCMKSSISSDCDISPKAVLEYCNFSAPVKVNDNCFLSGCCAKIGDPVEIPEGTFMHTVVISKDGRRCYATIFCGIGDDIKREVDAKNVVDLMLFNKPLSSYGAFRSMRHEPKLSLWTLKLFKICSTPDLSFYKSLEQINSLRNGMEVGLERDESMISMSDVLALKDVQGMLELRSFLNHTGISGTGIDIGL
ncbi:fucose-1-phosphate guanylyltransferase-like isoform X2 [Paramacrobiotus metropolitanus]|uniref:fucose-1-phosphate guanylyltransferase-like isoform X2 n=1 Tax=Paramacrobiotus metropolitanus TaxID=2943436 RepID=UPI002445E087|nr:fucose-1-phosphate guanylyltransferase-like isoform X2 [Paramacrobiotus metropolitanus]